MGDETVALRAEVAALQLKLHELHATDVNIFRRSYATIAQHVEALKLEASRLEALVHDVEPDIFTPDFVAEEFGKAAAVSGASWVLYKIVKSIPPIPPKAKSWLGGSLVVATAVVISWRFASSSIGRFASAFINHRRRKKAFLKEVDELQHRIDILQALTASLPTALSRTNLAAMAGSGQPAAAGEAGGAGGGAAAAAGVSPGPSLSAAAGGAAAGGNGGNGGQFVVVDLPRVESGGFVLPSPVPSPPPPAALAAAAAASLPPVPPMGGGAAKGAGAAGAPPPPSAPPLTAAGPFAAPSQQQLGGSSSGSGSGEPAHRLAAVQEGRAVQQPSQQQPEAPGNEGEGATATTTPSVAAGYAIPDSVMQAGWGGVGQQQPWQPSALPLYQQQQQHQQQQASAAGFIQQQQQQQQHHQQQQLLQQASPSVSTPWSSGTLGEEGEFVEQPSDTELQQQAQGGSSSRRTTTVAAAAAGQLLDTAGSGGDGGGVEQQAKTVGGQQRMQRGSPASSSSEDAVLLERE